MGIDLTFNQPFAEAVAFFRGKINIPTARWDDLWQGQHAKGFMIAGATKAELLSDFRAAVDKALSEGTTLATFRKDFDQIVAKHGWSYNGSRNWRSEVIYRTNIRTAYQAGRWTQLTDPDLLKLKPYLEYRHGDSREPRLQHLAWDGLTLPASDPWWNTHYPPNGWGCKCKVFAAGEQDLKRAGKPGPDQAPEINIDPATGSPEGIGKGWAYNVGQAQEQGYRVILDKFETLPAELGRKWMSETLSGPAFEQFFRGKLDGDFPVAVLRPEDMATLGSKAQSVWLSQESLKLHLEKHPDIALKDYRRIPEILDSGEVYRQDEQRLIYLQDGRRYYRAALKRTKDGRENFFLTLFETTEAKALEEVRQKYERIR
jgi:hypothetical protein